MTFRNGDGTLHAVCVGPEDGPLVILLHGFPEFWVGWQKQIAPLAEAGFRVIVPDQRGYNQSSKPAGVAQYGIAHLVSDVIAIADQTGSPTFFLAGHDWGAAVAWSVAIQHPDRISALAILNVPHPAVMQSFLKGNPGQMLRSWYIGFFQLPWLPEALISAFGFAAGKRALTGSSLPGTFSPEDLSQYVEAWSQPGALTAMINWYRAALTTLRKPAVFRRPRLTLPVLILWGEKDKFLRVEMAHASLGYCEHAKLRTFPQNTHWLQHERPEEVSQLLIEFFQKPDSTTTH